MAVAAGRGEHPNRWIHVDDGVLAVLPAAAEVQSG